MSITVKTAKTAATEDQVGQLHSLITRSFIMRTQAMLDEVEAGEEVALAINTTDLRAASQWVQSNGIIAVGAAEEEGSALKTQLDEIKARQRGRHLQRVV